MVTCYPVASKQKSANICQAFAQGCNGTVVNGASELTDGPAFFYGVDQSNLHLWRQAKADLRRDFYYCDNAYFDSAREKYFRITANRLQHAGRGQSDGARFDALNIPIKYWCSSGKHIVVCPQSNSFMRDIAEYEGDWTTDTLATLQQLTDRLITLRLWSPNKGRLADSIKEDLKDCYALVTWSSAAAITAILAGVPACVMGESAALPLALTRLEHLFVPKYVQEFIGRKKWAGVLADNQFTLDEMRSGYAWAKVQNG